MSTAGPERSFWRGCFGRTRSLWRAGALAVGLGGLGTLPLTLGCHSFLNSWLDPSQVGGFSHEATLEIRTSLSIQDTPLGIPGASDPTPEDLIPDPTPYELGPGDQISVRIFELMVANTETILQLTADEEGMVSVPILGRLRVSGLTAREMEAEIADILRQRDVLLDAQVVVEPIVKSEATFVIFGVVANPSLYPIRRPNFRLQEAISLAGGLLDTVTEVYVFRRSREPEQTLGARRPDDRPALASAQAASDSLGLALSDGLHDGGPSGPVPATRAADRPDEPKPASLLESVLNQQQEEQELIRAVTGGVPSSGAVATSPVATRSSAVETLPEEAPAQPRFIFVNNEWIEVAPVTTQPEPAPPKVPSVEPGATVPTEPTPRPTVDWSQIAEQEPEQRIIRISAAGLREGDARQDIIVRPGDSIRVAAGEVGEYYVMGQVFRPGAYALTGRRLTLKAAIASAGNIAPLGWPDRCTIYRRYGDREEMKQLNLDAIFAGKEPDLFIKKDDVILVGTHPAAPFLAVIRNAFRMTYGFGFVYDRNFADIDSYGGQPNPAFQQDRFPNLFR